MDLFFGTSMQGATSKRAAGLCNRFVIGNSTMPVITHCGETILERRAFDAVVLPVIFNPQARKGFAPWRVEERDRVSSEPENTGCRQARLFPTRILFSRARHSLPRWTRRAEAGLHKSLDFGGGNTDQPAEFDR